MPPEDDRTRRLDGESAPAGAGEETPVLRAGSRLREGRYRFERVIGRGGMAAVWLATDEVLDREVAIKVLSDTLIGDEEFLARFEREARVAARLVHPNLTRIYDYGVERSRPFLVMENVPGGDLGSRLEQGAPPDPDRLAREMLGALRHIHEAGIVHRDLKPTNVLFDAEGSARLADFGIAQPRDATSLTQTGLVLGTARYLAPEVAQGEPASEASDLFSLGVVLREVLDARPGSAELDRVAGELVRRDPLDRPRSAAAALAKLEPGAPVVASEAAPTEPIRRPAADTGPAGLGRPPRGRWAAIAAVVGAFLIGALALATLTGGDDDADRAADREPAAREEAAEQEAEPAEDEIAPVAEPEEAEPDPTVAPDGVALNDQGYELIQQGRPGEAIPILEQAVAALEGSGDLTHAYALYNLGHALRLAGRPEEAIPVLERRLETPNQRGTVRRELELARAEAGLSAVDDDDGGRGRGRSDDD